VGGILVTTADIANADFMAGNYKFTVPGAAGAKVINQGNITFGEAGLAGLVAPGVENSGTIVGKMGSVVVAGQDTFAVDLAGDGLMAFEVSPAAGATSVSNTGSIKNDGGYILITAGQASALVDGVVNVSGSVDASSSTANGGTIEVYGNTVNIASNASLRADGATGGGKVLLGGDLLKAGTSAGFLANSLNVGNDVTVSASATVNGDGGLVETSGHTLTLGPGLSISAFAIGADRQGGTWVIDPDDVEINTASTVATADFVDSVPLVAFLQGGGNALVDTNPGPFSGGPTTDGVDNGEPGDIFVNGGLGAINGAGVGSLTLVADNSIVINSAINTDGALTLQAVGSGVTIGANVTVGGTFTIESGGTVGGAGFAVTTAGLLDINAPGQTVLLSGNNDFQGQVDVTGAAITLSDVNGIILGDIDATGSLTVTAGGAVTQTANAGAGTVLDVGTTTSITATGFDVTLSDALNDFVGQC
jgi:hypothetical protein